jgi:hypothetical protein
MLDPVKLQPANSAPGPGVQPVAPAGAAPTSTSAANANTAIINFDERPIQVLFPKKVSPHPGENCIEKVLHGAVAFF